MTDCLLKIKNLSIGFERYKKITKVVNAVNLELKAGEVLGLVGESGCGKTTVSRSIIGLLAPQSKILGGQIFFNGKELLILSKKEMRRIRGNEIGMIFQDSMVSLNPVRNIGKQFIETICSHTKIDKKEAKKKSEEMLAKVNLANPERIMRCYPFQLSGGMKQRVIIAMALALKPKILIADEPTSALDVTVQAQILCEMEKLKEAYNTSILLVYHNLGVISQIADTVAVMYAGSIVEYGPANKIFYNPSHPYTKALMLAVPRLNSKQDKLISINGYPPDFFNMPSGCAFHPRCKFADSICKQKEPVLKEIHGGVKVACHLL